MGEKIAAWLRVLSHFWDKNMEYHFIYKFVHVNSFVFKRKKIS